MDASCIRCNEIPAVTADGYCGHCHWAVRAEVEEGAYALGQSLKNHAAFTAWCLLHGRDTNGDPVAPLS